MASKYLYSLGEHIHAKIDFREIVSTIADNTCGKRSLVENKYSVAQQKTPALYNKLAIICPNRLKQSLLSKIP